MDIHICVLCRVSVLEYNYSHIPFSEKQSANSVNGYTKLDLSTVIYIELCILRCSVPMTFFTVIIVMPEHPIR